MKSKGRKKRQNINKEEIKLLKITEEDNRVMKYFFEKTVKKKNETKKTINNR